MGTASPEGVLHVSRAGNVLSIFQSSDNGAVQYRLKTNSTNRRLVALDAGNTVQSQIVMGDNGAFTFAGTTTVTETDVRATLDSTGLDVNGTISLNGGQVHPDYVFESDYELPSIEEQAVFMWENKHLPAVGPGTYDEESGKWVLDLGTKTLGILEELEKAHIYIEQLNKALADKDVRIESLEARLARIEQLLADAS